MDYHPSHAPLRYRVTHTTRYRYDHAANMCHNLVYQKPLVADHQQLLAFQYFIDPEPDYLTLRKDFFDNEIIFFSILRSHKSLTVKVVSEVALATPAYCHVPLAQSQPWEQVRDWLQTPQAKNDTRQFCLVSAFVRFVPGVREYALESFLPGRPILEAAKDLNGRIYRDFAFTPGFTDISTPLEKVFKTRKGVCQDFAHFQLACMRSLGLAARYVSGYLETVPPPGKPKLIGADASHAWVGVYEPALGWVEFDATNNTLVRDRHVRAATGRDFTDLVPLKGVIYSGGSQQMQVSVDVARLK
jgi:transglutaminase-like putative cysteine protease